jgi:hypothetical protein
MIPRQILVKNERVDKHQYAVFIRELNHEPNYAAVVEQYTKLAGFITLCIFSSDHPCYLYNTVRLNTSHCLVTPTQHAETVASSPPPLLSEPYTHRLHYSQTLVYHKLVSKMWFQIVPLRIPHMSIVVRSMQSRF